MITSIAVKICILVYSNCYEIYIMVYSNCCKICILVYSYSCEYIYIYCTGVAVLTTTGGDRCSCEKVYIFSQY